MESAPYIDIHTHSKDKGDHLKVISLFLGEPYDELNDNPFTVGIHPYQLSDSMFDNLEQLLSQYQNRFIALGEAGLDRSINTPIGLQISIFERQLNIALQVGKPVIAHCVKAYSDFLELLKKYSSVTVLFHAYNGKGNTTEQLLKRNSLFSLGMRELNTRNGTEQVRKIPLDRLFLETDDSSDDIYETYATAATIIGIEITELKEIIFSNYKRHFA